MSEKIKRQRTPIEELNSDVETIRAEVKTILDEWDKKVIKPIETSVPGMSLENSMLAFLDNDGVNWSFTPLGRTENAQGKSELTYAVLEGRDGPKFNGRFVITLDSANETYPIQAFQFDYPEHATKFSIDKTRELLEPKRQETILVELEPPTPIDSRI